MRLRIRSSDGFLFAGAALLMVAALLLPGYELFGVGSGDLLASHLLLELPAVVVTMMVVIVAFFSLEEERSPLANSLILVFTLVAGIDLAHALSYPGMPPFLGTPNDMSKAAFFWMFGRAAEVLGFTLALCRVRLPGGRWAWFLRPATRRSNRRFNSRCFSRCFFLILTTSGQSQGQHSGKQNGTSHF